ncbi:MAG: M15 family metallopeptidase [Methylococcaceae bacterium]|nr:M15 family metallopeptidase [Methylococcaceae bacterium]
MGIPVSFVIQRRHPLYEECADLVSIGLDMLGREQRLERTTASHWEAMRLAADRDGIILAVVSAFRSFDHQRQIIARKLASGLSLEQITRVSALPGFSEHHTGRAIDIGTPGCSPVIEAFEQTPAFAWLVRRATDFSFRMSYPKGNPSGIAYEPWHWIFDAPSLHPRSASG